MCTGFWYSASSDEASSPFVVPSGSCSSCVWREQLPIVNTSTLPGPYDALSVVLCTCCPMLISRKAQKGLEENRQVFSY